MTTLLLLSNMSRQNEILALYACGVGNLRILSTLITIVSTFCTAAFLFGDTIVPIFSRKQALIVSGLDPAAEQVPTFNRTSFWYRSGSLIYNVGRFVPETSILEDVNIYRIGVDFQVAEKIHAGKAQFQNGDWLLESGFRVRYATPDRYPVTETFSSLAKVIPEDPSDFKTLEMREDTMRLRDLRKYITRNKGYGLDTTRQQVHYHERLAVIFTPIIFVLIAIPFATKPLRIQSVPRSIGYCFLVVFAYLLLFRMTLSLGKGGRIPPILSAWVPNALFFGYAVMAMFRKG